MIIIMALVQMVPALYIGSRSICVRIGGDAVSQADEEKPTVAEHFARKAADNEEAQSVSVVNLHSREFVGEVSTPGCALIFPAAKRKFHSICGDGTLLRITLDNQGNELDRSRSDVFFDANNDPIMEKGVRLGDRWLFPSFEGFLHEADVSGERVTFPEPWSLISAGMCAEVTTRSSTAP